jgi:hypothetical protein
MTPRRTEFAAFALDLLDFVEEKIGEAMENEPSRIAAIGEAAGAIPVVRDRLRENDLANTQCILALGNMIEQRWASSSLISPNRVSLPRKGCRVGLHTVLFEACSAFTRLAACTLARSPYFVTRYPKASDISSPPCLLRLLPGKSPCHGAHPKRTSLKRTGGGNAVKRPIPQRCNTLKSKDGVRARISQRGAAVQW